MHNVVLPFILVCMYPLTGCIHSHWHPFVHSYIVHSVARFSALLCWAARALAAMASSLAPVAGGLPGCVLCGRVRDVV